MPPTRQPNQTNQFKSNPNPIKIQNPTHRNPKSKPFEPKRQKYIAKNQTTPSKSESNQTSLEPTRHTMTTPISTMPWPLRIQPSYSGKLWTRERPRQSYHAVTVPFTMPWPLWIQPSFDGKHWTRERDVREGVRTEDWRREGEKEN